MVKKWLPVLLAVLLLPVIALADRQIIDDAGLFSDSEISRMEDIITRIENGHQVDMAVLATYDVPNDYSESLWQVRNYADDFYDNSGYGMGADNSGMLILLDMNNRALWLSTSGVMIEYITDAREESILDHAYEYLSYGRYGSGVCAALERVEYYMNKGRAEGTFLYDEVTGERLSGVHNALTTSEIGIAALIGGGAALVIGLTVCGSYGLKGGTYTYDKQDNISVRLTLDEETFVRQYVTRTPINTGTHGPSAGGHRAGGSRAGGSGVHRSSGGRGHGGGGRRF